MPADRTVDISTVDFSKVLLDRKAIESHIPHRGSMLLVDAVVKIDVPGSFIAGYKDCRADEFWAAGHFPGNPLLPGVLITEALSQLAVVFISHALPGPKLLWVMAGINRSRFRGMVKPGDRLLLAGRCLQLSRRGGRYLGYAYVEDKQVAETEVLALPG